PSWAGCKTATTSSDSAKAPLHWQRKDWSEGYGGRSQPSLRFARNGHKRQVEGIVCPQFADLPSTRWPPLPTAPSGSEQPRHILKMCILKLTKAALAEPPWPKAACRQRTPRYRTPKAPVPGTAQAYTKASGRCQWRVGRRESDAESAAAAGTQRGRAPIPRHTLART